MTTRVRAAAVAAIAACGLLGLGAAAATTAPAAPAQAGAVTYLDGEATRALPGKAERREPLKVGSAIFQGDVIETARRSRLELKLTDASVLRLGPQSRVDLDAAAFGQGPDDRKVSAKLRVGNVWASVTKALGGEARFEVKTENAVAGVRGTTFRVDASKDKSVVVKVYSGTVAVASGPIPRPEHASPGGVEAPSGPTGPSSPATPGPVPPRERRLKAPPREVTREQWEKIVTGMMLVRVAADGTPGEPEQFALAEGDDWELWNRERDATKK